jgi:hypothetical protein
VTRQKRSTSSGGDGHIVVWGGVSFWRSLMWLDLIDEFHLDLHPYVAGEDTRLFDDVPKSDQPQSPPLRGALPSPAVPSIRHHAPALNARVHIDGNGRSLLLICPTQQRMICADKTADA